MTSSLSESDYGNNSKTIDLNKTTADGIHNWVKDEKSGKYICSICGKKIEDDYSGELKGLSLSLSDDIGLNFVMQLSDSLLIDKDNSFHTIMNFIFIIHTFNIIKLQPQVHPRPCKNHQN